MPRFQTLLGILLLLCAGCDKPAPPATPPLPPPTTPAPPVPPAAPVAPAAPMQAAAPMAPADPAKAIADIPWKLVDKNKAMADNPKLTTTENKIVIGDPVSVAGSAYFSAISQIKVIELKSQIDLHKATNDKWPTYDELSGMLKSVNFQFPGLKPWQVYAYDEKDGSISLLEDPDAKAAAYKKVGL